MSRAMPAVRSSSPKAASSILNRLAVNQNRNMANAKHAIGSTPDGIRYSPNCTEPVDGPSKFTSAARKIVTTVPAMETQNRLDSESMDRISASAGMDSG